ncbi:MAG: hypothetical protein K2X67_00605 [Burkholderiales bacterium]|nr:hypothetical protein [Burkholderiales bacterium]
MPTTEAFSSGFAFSITLSTTVPRADGIAFAIRAAGTGIPGILSWRWRRRAA